MKKTFNINLNSQVFCIDEDACVQLQNYIETLEKYYLAEEDGKEIMADIESRIAELFQDFLQKSHKEVISQAEIDKVIEIMGTPDVIIDEDAELSQERKTIKRKLYRDPDHAILGGVASGLGAYLSIPAIWLRLAFILLLFCYGMTLIVYIVLWIVIPKANTAKQKLEMKGEKINVSNIEKNIRDTYNDVKKNSKLRDTSNFIGQKCSAFFCALGEIIKRILSVIGNILAVVGLLIGIFFFLFSCWTIFFGHHFIPENYYTFSRYLFAPISLWVMKLLIFLLVNIPALLVTYLSANHLFRFRKQSKVILGVSGGIWILCCFAGIFLGSYFIGSYSQDYEDETRIPLVTSDTTIHQINIKFKRLHNPKNAQAINCSSDDYILYCPRKQNNDSNLLYLKPRILFEKTKYSSPVVFIEKKACGFSGLEAAENTEKINYQYEWKNDTLFLNNYFTLSGNRWRNNKVYVRVLIPENYQLNLQNASRTDITNRYIFENYLLDTSTPQKYMMREGKLVNLME